MKKIRIPDELKRFDGPEGEGDEQPAEVPAPAEGEGALVD